MAVPVDQHMPDPTAGTIITGHGDIKLSIREQSAVGWIGNCCSGSCYIVVHPQGVEEIRSTYHRMVPSLYPGIILTVCWQDVIDRFSL